MLKPVREKRKAYADKKKERDKKYDENNIVCVKYNGAEWYHYRINAENKVLEWW